MESNQISDCENQSEKTLAQRIREEKNCFIVKNGKVKRHDYQKPWNQETEKFDKIQCEKCGKMKEVYCEEHDKMEKVKRINLGFGQKVEARRCVTYWYQGMNEPKYEHEDFFEYVPIEEGY